MLLEARIPLRYLVNMGRRDAVNVLLIAVVVQAIVASSRRHLPDIPTTIPALLGTAISLLLSFRLNQSYDRWWEARKVWGGIVNDSRTLVRQVLSLATGDGALSRRIGRRQIAWCYCLGQSLRGGEWRQGSVDHLSEEDIAEAERHANKSLALLQMHARDVARMFEEGQLSDYRRVAIDETLTRLTDGMGMAERIRSTVFPRTYRMFLHFFIYLFITVLAFALAEIGGAWSIATTWFIAMPFFLLEKSAAFMQDPFAGRPTDTPVTTIARTVEINVRQLMGDGEAPAPLSPREGFYSM